MEAEDAFALFADGVSDHVVLLFQSHAVYKGSGRSDAVEALAITIHQQAADARDIENPAHRGGTGGRTPHRRRRSATYQLPRGRPGTGEVAWRVRIRVPALTLQVAVPG
ncbi:hypothetical protein ACFVZW_06450 [Streptomyces sp. NPDC059567]|uniref:hypothetical protein n=1 Tax=Streptomyces sp. NPDC059567 TaxID=3346867 RepID=UPI00368D1247